MGKEDLGEAEKREKNMIKIYSMEFFLKANKEVKWHNTIQVYCAQSSQFDGNEGLSLRTLLHGPLLPSFTLAISKFLAST